VIQWAAHQVKFSFSQGKPHDIDQRHRRRSHAKIQSYRHQTDPSRRQEKVTGQAKYGADIHMAGMLHGKILRSPHAHARILSIDTSRAEALSGVRTVAVARDFAISADQPLDFNLSQAGPRLLAENDLARDKVMYKGHAVAAIAATNHHIAAEAIGLNDVVYEKLPAVLDVQDAMKDDAPILHDKPHNAVPTPAR
jgi:CO/xanthine dehydrogenase Mo-binding subunit